MKIGDREQLLEVRRLNLFFVLTLPVIARKH